MQNMKLLRFLLLVILSVGVISTGLFIQIAIGTESSVLSEDFYHQHFTRHNIYDLSQRYVLLRIKEGLNGQLTEPVVKALLAASKEAFSNDWSQEQATSLIKGFLSYTTGASEHLSLSIDLKSRKDILEQGFLMAITKTNGSSFSAALSHLPAGLEDGHISRLLPLPDYVDLAQSSFFKQAMVQNCLRVIRDSYPVVRYFPILLMIFVVGWILVCGWGSGLKWSGISLVLSSIVFMIFVSASAGILDRYILLYASGKDELLIALGTNPLVLAKMFRDEVVAVYFNVGIISGGVGAALGILGYRLEKHAAQDSSSPVFPE